MIWDILIYCATFFLLCTASGLAAAHNCGHFRGHLSGNVTEEKHDLELRKFFLRF